MTRYPQKICSIFKILCYKTYPYNIVFCIVFHVKQYYWSPCLSLGVGLLCVRRAAGDPGARLAPSPPSPTARLSASPTARLSASSGGRSCVALRFRSRGRPPLRADLSRLLSLRAARVGFAAARALLIRRPTADRSVVCAAPPSAACAARRLTPPPSFDYLCIFNNRAF